MKNSASIIKYSSVISKFKDDYELFLDTLLQTLKEIMVAKVDLSKISNQIYKQDYIKLASEYSYQAISKIADKIIFAKLMLDSNCNPVSTIENLLMGILEVKYYAKGS